MSWLSIPLPNPFKSLNFSFDDDEVSSDSERSQRDSAVGSSGAVASPGGVKDDISAIGETIGRQLRGVAAFLVPPPQPPQSSAGDDDGEDSSSQTLAGIRSDLAEIGGSFKSSLSLFSTSKAVSELSKLASNILQLNDENEGYEDEESAARLGITHEVIEFVKELSTRPECWTDFPLTLNDDFNMSDAQIAHALVVEQLLPSLASIRESLGADMSDKRFWMIYFILLFPRLDENDRELLSTPEVVEARDTLLLMLQNKKSLDACNSEESEIDESIKANSDPDKAETQNVLSEEKAISAESFKEPRGMENKDHESVNWSEEEVVNTRSTYANKQLKSEDDVSFSDLEDDDSDSSNRRLGSGMGHAGPSSRPGSSDWVRLNKNAETTGSGSREVQPKYQDRDYSEDDETNDWLTVDDFDPASMAAV
ncbi:hypothetical protein Nepgr_006398 [Nepenthes gracilis]|uniref:BSD domain-containing protein n=1 Tax=Nepenthes gracilis TaxID=150966 RepID=A0AAD3XHC1_NEPGR|nr:hypothetical protein Nepgr_006398 [Nepenthes gracilis]